MAKQPYRTARFLISADQPEALTRLYAELFGSNCTAECANNQLHVGDSA
jgi:hypothetical protein